MSSSVAFHEIIVIYPAKPPNPFCWLNEFEDDCAAEFEPDEPMPPPNGPPRLF